MAQMSLSTKVKQTQGYREHVCGFQRGGGWGGEDWEFEISRCKLLYTGWLHNKVLLYRLFA